MVSSLSLERRSQQTRSVRGRDVCVVSVDAFASVRAVARVVRVHLVRQSAEAERLALLAQLALGGVEHLAHVVPTRLGRRAGGGELHAAAGTLLVDPRLRGTVPTA